MRVAGREILDGGELLGAGDELRALRGVGALRAAPGGVGADARPHLHRRPRGVQGLGHFALEQQLEPAVMAPVAHAGRAALADGDEPGLLQPLERLPHHVPARLQFLAEVALRGQRVSGRVSAAEDVRPQPGVDLTRERTG